MGPGNAHRDPVMLSVKTPRCHNTVPIGCENTISIFMKKDQEKLILIKKIPMNQ